MACKSYALAIFNHTCNIHNYCDLFTWAGKEKHLQEEWRSKFTSVLLTRSCEHFLKWFIYNVGFHLFTKVGEGYRLLPVCAFQISNDPLKKSCKQTWKVSSRLSVKRSWTLFSNPPSCPLKPNVCNVEMCVLDKCLEV